MQRIRTAMVGSKPWSVAQPKRIGFGGDYNPEQWDEQTRREDMRLMREAGVDLVTVAVFSWALLEPREGEYTLDWLAEIIDQLHENGIGVDLATSTAAVPAWFANKHPESLQMLMDGTRVHYGSRQTFCTSSPAYRERAAGLVEQLAARFAHHPGVRLWHVHNELGGHNAICYCDVSAAAFRDWLQNRYETVGNLDDAWGTRFWSQVYGSFDEVQPPRQTAAHTNPGQQLDFQRFSSDQLLALYLNERTIIKAHNAEAPVTTNLMGFFKPFDYWRLAPHMDVIANDHYLVKTAVDPHIDLSCVDDLVRGLKPGVPWILMEQGASAVNWQLPNLARPAGELLRSTMTHVARGADAIAFFQWRQSRNGGEKYHSAMLPHAGENSAKWREIVQLREALDAISEVVGSTVKAQIAVLFDWESWWALEHGGKPSDFLRWNTVLRAWYDELWRANVTVDFVHPDADLSPYKAVLVPTLYMVRPSAAENLERFVADGGHALVSYWSGIVDQTDTVYLGGYPGALRDLLGVRIEEIHPLLKDTTATLSDGTTCIDWTELGQTTTADVLATYTSGSVAGSPAITRNQVGAGSAWYMGAHLQNDGMRALLERFLAAADCTPSLDDGHGVEQVRRSSSEGSWLFAINHSAETQTINAHGLDLITGQSCDGQLTLAAGSVAVIRE